MAAEKLEIVLVEGEGTGGGRSRKTPDNQPTSNSPQSSKTRLESTIEGVFGKLQKQIAGFLSQSTPGRASIAAFSIASDTPFIKELMASIKGASRQASESTAVAGQPTAPERGEGSLFNVVSEIRDLVYEMVTGRDRPEPEPERKRLPFLDPEQFGSASSGAEESGPGRSRFRMPAWAKNLGQTLKKDFQGDMQWIKEGFNNSAVGKEMWKIAGEIRGSRAGQFLARKAAPLVGRASALGSAVGSGLGALGGRALALGGRAAAGLGALGTGGGAAATAAVGAGATAAGTALTALVPPVAALIAIFGSLAAAGIGVSWMLKRQANELEEYSGSIKAARIARMAQDIELKVDRVERIGPDLGMLEEARNDLARAQYELMTEIYSTLVKFGPAIETGMDGIEVGIHHIETLINLYQSFYERWVNRDKIAAGREIVEAAISMKKAELAMKDFMNEAPAANAQSEWVLGQDPHAPPQKRKVQPGVPNPAAGPGPRI